MAPSSPSLPSPWPLAQSRTSRYNHRAHHKKTGVACVQRGSLLFASFGSLHYRITYSLRYVQVKMSGMECDDNCCFEAQLELGRRRSLILENGYMLSCSLLLYIHLELGNKLSQTCIPNLEGHPTPT